MNNLLEVRDLKMHFSGVKAVDGVSFTVKEGSMLGIIGPNGSGKTTVYNALTGVYTPTAGQVVFNGTNITGKPMYDMVHYGIARTFQNLRFYRGMTVLENIMMGNYSMIDRTSSMLYSIPRDTKDIGMRQKNGPMRFWRWYIFKTKQMSMLAVCLMACRKGWNCAARLSQTRNC